MNKRSKVGLSQRICASEDKLKDKEWRIDNEDKNSDEQRSNVSKVLCKTFEEAADYLPLCA